MIEIREIATNKKRFVDLLLIGDEQESMIDRYINECRLFIGYICGIPSVCCAVKLEAENIIEVKNLAVLPEHRRKGIGRKRWNMWKLCTRTKYSSWAQVRLHRR